MRDLHDAHVSDMMLDLTGERRGVPPIAAGPVSAALPVADRPRYTEDGGANAANACGPRGRNSGLGRGFINEPTSSVSQGPATHVHAGGGNGAQRAPEGLGDPIDDSSYRLLLLEWVERVLIGLSGQQLDAVGALWGLPRARLVRAEAP